MKNIKKQKKKIIISVILVLVTLYILYAIYLLIKEPTDTFTVEEGTLYLEETTVGYVIREETVIKGNNYKNGMVQIVNEGQRAAKNESVFRYYSTNEENLTEKINELDIKIQDALSNETDLFSADIKQLEKQIDEKVLKLNQITDYSKILELKKEISNLVTKKAEIAGDLSTQGSYIKQLISERSKYEQQLNSGAEYVKTPVSGLISYRVDGLEETLSTTDFSNLTSDYLESLNLKTGKIIATSDECGKVINNFECYIAISLNSEEAKNSEVGDSLAIRLSNNKELKAEIAYKKQEDDQNVLLVLKTYSMPDELVNYRKVSVEIIWWSDTGLKIPNQAIVEEDGLNYVVRNKAGYLNKILVKVLRQNDKYSIVDTYSTDELEKLEYDTSAYKKLGLYDEILLYPDLSKIK